MRIFWLAIPCLLSAVATADPDARRHLTSPQADVHLQAGLDAYDAKQWEHAATELEEANTLEPTPYLLYAWAQAERFGGHCAKAVELYRKFLYTDATITPAWLAATRGFIKECEAALPIPPAAPPAPPPPPRQSWYKDPIVDGLAISSGFTLLLGVGYLAAASSNADAARHAMHLDEFTRARADRSSDVAIGGTALGIGVALAGGAAFVYWTRYRGHRTEAVVTTDGHSVIYAATF